MTHYCSRCHARLHAVVAHNLWGVHKVCVGCKLIYACWGEGAFRCETPALHVPHPWTIVDGPQVHGRKIIPGPQHRGLL